MLARAMTALPNMRDWQFYVQTVSIGADVRESRPGSSLGEKLLPSAMAVEFMRLWSQMNHAKALALEDGRAKGLDGHQLAAHAAQLALESFWNKARESGRLTYEQAMTVGYKMFQNTETWNRNLATITTLMSTRRFLSDQVFDPLAMGEAARFAEMPKKFQSYLLRQWALYARQQDENINYDYSRVMRPRWLRKPYMEFFGKFATFSNASWVQRMQNVGEAVRLLDMGPSRDMLFARRRGQKPDRTSPLWRRMMNSRVYVSAADIPAEEWTQFVRDVYGIEDTEGIATATKRISEKLEREGIVIEDARFNPLARAVRFMAIYPLQKMIQAAWTQQLLLSVEPISEFFVAMIDLLEMMGPPEDDEELRDFLATVPAGHWIHEEDNVELIVKSPLYLQYRERKFESVLQRIAFSAPVGGLVISQLLKWMLAHMTGSAVGVRWRPAMPETVVGVFRLAQVRTWMESVADMGAVGRGEKDVSDLLMPYVRPYAPERFTYWQEKMRKEAESIVKNARALKEPQKLSYGVIKKSAINPIERAAKANIEALKRARRGEGPWWGLWGVMISNSDLWRLESRTDRQQLFGVYTMFERARLGDITARANIKKDPARYPLDAYEEWVAMMQSMGFPDAADEDWMEAYEGMRFPQTMDKPMEFRNLLTE